MVKASVDKTTWGEGGLFANRVLGSLLLIIGTPLFILLFLGTTYFYDGSFIELGKAIASRGVLPILKEQFPNPWNPYTWKMITTYIVFELLLMKFLPGKIFKANATATGYIPVYTANGVASYLVTIIALFALAYYKVWNPVDAFDHFGELLVASNILALLLCVFLTFKGLYFPSTKDAGTNGNIIVDFFWGTELYPHILGFNVKQFTNCRYGMMLWQVLIICYGFKQYELFGFVSSSIVISIVLQTAYIYKFFLWECGYFCTMDIQHDRAGYYICWGCMMWLPCMYTIHTYWLATHPLLLSLPTTVLLTAAGILCVWCNYDCDRQRQEFRATDGKKPIWGQAPDYVKATYTTSDGKVRSSLLLASGWWGLARHFHYIPEILASVFWCVPVQVTHPLPYFYPGKFEYYSIICTSFS